MFAGLLDPLFGGHSTDSFGGSSSTDAFKVRVCVCCVPLSGALVDLLMGP